MKELNRVFSCNFESTSKMLNHICNNRRIFDFNDGGYIIWNNYNNKNALAQHISNLYNLIIVDRYNYHQYHSVLSYETRSSRKTKYFVKEDNYYRSDLQYRILDHPRKITNKQFKQSIKDIHYHKNIKRGYRRNY